MSRPTKLQIAARSALENLNCIHELAGEGGNAHATYHRNAGDCTRWCAALRAAGVAYPEWMHRGGLKYFAAMWRLPDATTYAVAE
jgi:hypothetical protein